MSVKRLYPEHYSINESLLWSKPQGFLLLSFSNTVFIVTIQVKPLLCHNFVLKCCGSPLVICIFLSLSAPGKQNLRIYFSYFGACRVPPFLAGQITCHSELPVQHYVDGDLTSFLLKEWKIVHLIDRFSKSCLWNVFTIQEHRQSEEKC